MAVLFSSLILAAIAFMHSSTATDVTDGGIESPERELRRDLFRGYDKYVRPVIRQSDSVPLSISLSPLALRSMNLKEQLISLEGWLMFNWTDAFLTWDPSEYDNIKVIHVSPAEVWKPDIALYTASPDSSLFPTVYTQALLYNTGKVLWVPPFTINSRCPIPFRNYVDAAREFVECNIRFGSWTYSGKAVDLQLSTDKVDLTNFVDYHHEWKLVKIVSDRVSKKYPCCVEEYPYVDFNVTLKRRNFFNKFDETRN